MATPMDGKGIVEAWRDDYGGGWPTSQAAQDYAAAALMTRIDAARLALVVALAERDAEVAALREDAAGVRDFCGRVETERDEIGAERDTLTARVAEYDWALRLFEEWHGGGLPWHADDCPQDDTCDCPDSARLTALLAPPPGAEKEERP